MGVVRNSPAAAGSLTIVLNVMENFMTRILTPLAIAALMLVGSYTFADDEISQAGMAQQHKMMKDCMAKHASEDTHVTKGDMEKACKEEIKSQKDNSNAMSGSPQK
jgi:Na+-translocating ferredoxin:NAD+ oxidoreductase RnfG subunit